MTDLNPLDSIDYINFTCIQGEGDIVISHELDSYSDLPDSKRPVEETLLDATDPVWSDLLEVNLTLSGWDRKDVVFGGVSSGQSAFRRNASWLSRTVASGIPVSQSEWNGFHALLHLRGWHAHHSIDNGAVDLYFAPESDPHGIKYSLIENDPAIIEKLASLQKSLAEKLAIVMGHFLPEQSERLLAVGIQSPHPHWEEESMPVYGGGSYCFHFIAL